MEGIVTPSLMEKSEPMPEAQEAGTGKLPSQAALPAAAIAFLVLTAAISLLTSKYRVLGGDDFYQIWSDNASSIRQVWQVQKSFAVVIDPFFYHAITFAGIHLFGIRPMLLRLPSLLGFLLMQLSLFYFVRRIASEKAAIFALAFPVLTGAFGYTTQLRPYGVLLGLFGLAMISWQTAVRRETHRTWPLVTLALSIALATNSHYYGILLLVPLCAAELFRAWQRRRIDLPVLLSIGAGLAGIVFMLPLLKGASEFSAHYYGGTIPLRVVTQSYNFILLGKGQFGPGVEHMLAVALVVLMALVLWGCLRQLRTRTATLPYAEFVFLIVLAALPFVSFLLGRFITHAVEARYTIGSVIGIAALLSIALLPLFRNQTIANLALALLFVAIAARGVVSIRAEKEFRQNILASLVVSPEVKAAILASPGKSFYTQDIDLFSFVTYYAPDTDISSRLKLVYSREEEMRWNHNDTSTRIEIHMKSFTPFPIVPFESLATQPGGSLFVMTTGGWIWTDKAFASEPQKVKYIGQAYGFNVVSVRFP
jgi:hypothetical protein